MMYLHLFHGRTRPDEKLEGWGREGPCLRVSWVKWTYGSIAVGEPTVGVRVELLHYDDLIEYDGIFYADMEIRWAPVPDMKVEDFDPSKGARS